MVMRLMLQRRELITGALGVLLTGAYLGIGSYFYNFALNAKKKKSAEENPEEAALQKLIDPKIEETARLSDKQFAQEHPPVSWRIVSRDSRKLKLQADVYPGDAASRKWAVVVHGYTGHAGEMVRWIRGFHKKGYHVLAPNLRGHGQSEGDYIGMGWHDRQDLLLWIKEIIRQHPDAEIVLFGISMGAATVMMASGEELPSNVKVILEDCGFSSARSVFTYQLGAMFGLPEFPVIPALNTVTRIRAGYDLYRASAVKQVKKSRTPILFIHGDLDTLVPFAMLDEVYQAAPGEKEMLVVPGAKHAESIMVAPDLYWRTIWDFVGRYIT